MQPLKRFTQCGSLTMLFVVFIVLFGVSSTALTTFGKSNPNTLQQPTPPPPKGRECSTHSDCTLQSGTSCVVDPNDERTRCLCGNNIAPINGACSADFKSLHHLCPDSSDKCDYGMICGVNNATKNTPIGRLVAGAGQAVMKECLCDEENGFIENAQDLVCNHGVVLAITNTLVPVMSLIATYFFSSSSLHH